MTGREENTYKIENKIKEKLSKQPRIIKDYYYSLTEKTATTKKVYINYVIDFVNDLKHKGINGDLPSAYKNITKKDINAYIDGCRYNRHNGELRENGASILRSRLYAIKNYFDFLVDEGIIENNVCDKIKMPKMNSDIKVIYLTEEEVNKVKSRIVMYAKYPARDLAIFVLGIRTGLRIESIIEINISDIDFNDNCITVTEKGNKRRTVYFGEDTKKILLSWINVRGKHDTDALFISNRGTRISYTVPKTIFKKYANDFNKKTSCHKMRSTFATNAYDKSGDIYLTADALGHRNLSNTRRYTNISEANKRKAAEMLDSL